MKRIVIIMLLFTSSVLIAQRQNAPKGQQFNASLVVGIFYYEENKALKKIKIKKKEIKYSVKKAIISYNSKVKELSFLKSAELSAVTTIVNTTKVDPNNAARGDFRKRVGKILMPIRDSIQGFENQLNTTLKTYLTKKQFKNWLKFQKKTKRDLQPEAPDMGRRSSPPSRRNMGQRRRY